MRNLLIVAVVLVSMCISNVSQASVIIEDDAQTDIFVKAEAAPTQVKSGRNLDMIFEIRNKRPDAISDVNLLAYDQCIFSGENNQSFSEIRSNETKIWSWKWRAGEVNTQRDCEIRFKIDYVANFSRTQALAVLTENEYNQRDQAGTLGSVTTSTSASGNPIDILLSFSQSLPLIENDRISMYIDYIDKEAGFIDKLSSGDIRIEATQNMQDIDCNDYDLAGLGGVAGDENELVLNRDLKFIGGKASRSTCTFSGIVSSRSPVDVQTLTLTAMYKYSLDNSLTVRVIPS